MRGAIGRTIPNSAHISYASKQVIVPFSSSASSSSGGHGRGRGRGSGSGSSFDSAQIDFTASRPPGKPNADISKIESPGSPFSSGSGHGRGKAAPSSPTLPSFFAFIPSVKSSSAGRGQVTEEPKISEGADSVNKKPVFFVRENAAESATGIQPRVFEMREEASKLHQGLISGLSGAGRGQPMKQPERDSQIKEENRHTRSRQGQGGRGAVRGGRGGGVGFKMSMEEAANHAVGILLRGGSGGEDIESGGRGREGFRGRGGRTRGGFRGRGTGTRGRDQDTEDRYASGLYLGNNADGEELAERLGTYYMNQLSNTLFHRTEGFEEMSGRILPSPLEEQYLDSMHTNFMMGDFESNPDIDEKPPIPLREALEKMKPFLMAYEGIENEAEWQENINETMERAPLMKEIVDDYAGPDTFTAKEQQEELERVAKTLAENAPNSVKQFTNQAVLSLQSNPGWGFHRKCQFMDKLFREVTQHYKWGKLRCSCF